jgi:Ca2+-binding RTX toxin-like protein
MTVTRQGPEFRINTTTLDSQETPAIAVSDNGSYLVVWESDSQDGSLGGIFAQRFAANGSPIDNEFRVNLVTVDDQENPSVAATPDGGFIVIWESDGQDGSRDGIFGRRFDADGNFLGIEFQVNVTTNLNQDDAAIAVDRAGNFVITWTDQIQDGNTSGVFARRFDADGNPLGLEFQVNTEISNSQENPAIALRPNGDFVIAWESNLQDGSEDGIFAQRFRSNGTRIGQEFQVNTTFSDDQLNPDIAIANDGSFVIVWESQSQDDGGSTGIYAQRFAANGSRLGNEFRVNATAFGDQTEAAIAMDARGNFVVTWTDSEIDDSNDGIVGRAFDRNGRPIGGEFLVNSFTTNEQSASDIGLTPNGRLVSVWQSTGQDGSSTGIYGQRFVADFAVGETINGNGGNNLLRGGAGDDRISGRGGDDVLVGRGGDDRLSGNTGEDVLRGGSGGDRLRGGGQADRLLGGGGSDVLQGGSGNDELRGGGGRDRLVGGSGDDVLVGNGGQDTLIGSGGNDDLRGNGGADIFVLAANRGEDRIRDYVDGVDNLALSGNLAFADLSFGQNGNRTVIRANGDRIAVLDGVQAASITAADFTTL